MNLAVFDIDGTLTRTTGVDDACFLQTLDDIFGIRGLAPDWSLYPHVTDASLARAIYSRHPPSAPGRSDTTPAILPPDRLEAFRERFLTLLREQAAVNPARFSAVPGAGAFLARLSAMPGWTVALATGAWHGSAMIKLTAAGLLPYAAVLATCDDACERHAIVTTAVGRAGNPAGFSRIVCLGDGPWDARTARDLNYPFVGVRHGGDPAPLHAEGVAHVITDYTNPDAVLDILDRASIPGR